MLVTPIQTPLLRSGDDLLEAIRNSLGNIPEKSILVVSSKIVSTCEGRFVKKIEGTREEKHNLVRQEADRYTDPLESKYNMMLALKRNLLFVNAGIDESNADNQYILWPKDPQRSTNALWTFVREHYGVKDFGVTIADSSSFMLSPGVIGRAIAHCGFNPLRSYVGTQDLYGKIMQMEQTNVMQSVTDAAVLEMGEGDECTPMALVSDFHQKIEFLDHVPTDEELKKIQISIEDDVYYPLLKDAKWHTGGGLLS